MCVIALATFFLFFVVMFALMFGMAADLTGMWLLIGILAASYLGRKWYDNRQRSN